MSVYFREAKFNFSKYADGGYALISGGAGGIGYLEIFLGFKNKDLKIF